MSKDQFPRVTFTAGTAPPALILERASAAKTPFSWRLQGDDYRSLELAMSQGAPGDGELSPAGVVRVCNALWDCTQGEAESEDEQELRDNAFNLRSSILECFNIEEV